MSLGAIAQMKKVPLGCQFGMNQMQDDIVMSW